MKLQRTILLLGLMLVTILAAGCTQSSDSAGTPSATVPTLSVNSATPSPTNFPRPTVTSTAVPTLPVEDARTKLLELLGDNGQCRLPCLWGITPGKSTDQEARAILMPLSSLSSFADFSSQVGHIAPHNNEGDLEIGTDVGFLTNSDNDSVSHISFHASARKEMKQELGYEDVFNSTIFGERVRAYMLPQVLSDQGIPSSVLIATLGGPLTRGGTGGFHILLLYPDQGILVNYTTQMQLVGENVRGCPSNAHVELELYPSGKGDIFLKLLAGTDWPQNITNNYKPLGEVTSMSLEQFYQTFRQPTDKCIETPANLWPTPEP